MQKQLCELLNIMINVFCGHYACNNDQILKLVYLEENKVINKDSMRDLLEPIQDLTQAIIKLSLKNRVFLANYDHCLLLKA